MTAGQQADQHPLHQMVLADDDPLHLEQRMLEQGRRNPDLTPPSLLPFHTYLHVISPLELRKPGPRPRIRASQDTRIRGAQGGWVRVCHAFSAASGWVCSGWVCGCDGWA
ncbi:hypothetical protein GCM10009743_68890 [Kribbella swartbergensis]